ncbi:MAG: hypothetical protein H0Z39_06710 [Peptococcaceae bacterium]|nr:hypothetical protein [Peptococcaceae bacterium]
MGFKLQFELLGFVSLSNEVRKADLEGISPFDIGGKVAEEIREIKENLLKRIN